MLTKGKHLEFTENPFACLKVLRTAVLSVMASFWDYYLKTIKSRVFFQSYFKIIGMVNYQAHVDVSFFSGETRRKFESVHTGGTMSTPDGGKISQYWHCCGSEDPFDVGCVAAPHSSYDD